MIAITRHAIKHKSLMPLVKFIWHLAAEQGDIHRKLLPTDSIDVILNLSGSMVYEVGAQKITAPPFHLNGLRSKPSYIHHTGKIETFGLSFRAFGLYPFVRQPLTAARDRIIDLFTFSKPFAEAMKSAVMTAPSTDEKVAQIEKALLSLLSLQTEEIRQIALISAFLDATADTTIQRFCQEEKMTIKTVERMLLRYTGYTPKALQRIKRFQASANQLVHATGSTLTEITYDQGFTDQSHFTKEFSCFSGATPRSFQQKKETIKENVIYTYC